MRVYKNKIELIMAEKGLSAIEVSKRSRISPQTFSTIKLRGTCTPATAGKLAHGLGVDVSEILKEDEK